MPPSGASSRVQGTLTTRSVFRGGGILVNEYSIALKTNDVVQGHNFMRPFHFTIALAATLTGCSTCLAPQQASQMDSKTVVTSEKSIAVKKKNPRHRTNANTRPKIAEATITAKVEMQRQPDDKSNAELKKSIATKIETPQPSQSDGKSSGEANTNTTAAKTETSPSSQLDDESVIKLAKLAIAAKMDNPASVEFLEIKRAARKDALGNSIDAICGHVRGKLAGDPGDRPFLYVVQKDKAYIGAYTIAATEYRNVCN